jgi:pyruvate dehydrogenase (quinone)
MRYQQEVDLLALFKDVSVYDQRVMGAGHAQSLVDAACRAALSAKGVAHLTCPVDLNAAALHEDAHRLAGTHTAPELRRSSHGPPAGV